MKHLLLLLLLCMGMTSSSPAQQFFNKRDPLHSYLSVITGVVVKDNKYYCSTVAVDSANTVLRRGARFLVFDSAGAKTSNILYQLPDRNIFAWNNSLRPLSDGGFVLVATSVDTAAYYAMIIKYDSAGNIAMSKEIPKAFCTSHDFLFVTDLKPVESSQWLMLSRIACKPVGSSLQHDIVLTKLDSSFNVIWHKQIGDPAMDDVGWKLLIEPDGYLIAGGRNNIGQVQKNFTCQTLLYKTDTAGTYKWHWLSDPSKKTFEAKDVIRTQDGGYVYCGQGDGYEELSSNQTYSIPHFKGWVEKLDANRNVVWSKTINNEYSNWASTEQRVLKELANGDIIVAGSLWEKYSTSDTENHHYGALTRLDIMGNTIWQRKYRYGNDTLTYLIYDMDQTADGGFAFCGEATDKYPPFSGPVQRGWIVKVDSNGCLGPTDPQCWPAAVPRSPTAHQVTVYPNPVKDAWHISNRDGKQLKVMISDITGRTIIQRETYAVHTEIVISSYPAGIYLYKISGKDGIHLQGKLLKE